MINLPLRLTDPALATIRDRFARAVPEPVGIRDVLSADRAAELLQTLADVGSWRREYFIEEFLGGTRRVDQATFEASTEVSKFASWSTVDLDAVAGKPGMRELLDELSDLAFLDLLASFGRPGVQPPRFKLRRYGPGDFFASHCDGDCGLGVLIYLTDPPWRDGDGGRLVYEPYQGTEVLIPPLHNSAVFLPYTLTATHRVEPVAPDGATRYTLGCDYA